MPFPGPSGQRGTAPACTNQDHPHHDGPAADVVAVVTDRAAQRAKELGAGDVLEALRAEPEHRPRLGRLIRTVTEGGQQVALYSTRIEGDPATGLLPCGQAAVEAFYRLIGAAYERHSVIVASSIQPAGFDSIMPKALALATAAVDRLPHHSRIVLTEGASLRLVPATVGWYVFAVRMPDDAERFRLYSVAVTCP
ncbi:ATP-binding protein, partial [Kitasatospora sp. NPDC018058]|uniref:ATP-binding protein n=1 Tax=Kitasatospora sp. NPDC018058 TaxID=3364025 RepID=UPI0037BEBEB6